jgi:adenine-specific DNA-methyltransferase
MNKQDLISKIKQLDGISQDERSYLINLVNTKKKYGLVWEDKPEEVEEQLRQNLPVLKEVKDKAIINGEDNPNHILIEGDNLHALTALTFTHEGKIDVIYIDPPYNTGKRNEFRYNDKWVDSNSPFKHSMWLSYLNKRLKIAKMLMSENSAIFISIDNNEYSQLKLLCDEIFYENNYIGTLIWRKKEGGGQTDAYFVTEHEYILCYKKGNFNWINHTEEGNVSEFNKKDENGSFKIVKLEKWGSGARKEDRPTMHFSITSPDGNDYYPIAPDGNPGRYRVGKNTMNDIINEQRIHWEKKDFKWIPYEKIYFDPEKNKIIKARSILYKLANTGAGSNELTDIFNSKDIFENPKPTDLIKFVLSHSSLYNSTILDFFAGSGTTLHATMDLNNDGGNRQCILVTNNENNICEEVTYERNKRVIEGYTNTKEIKIEALKNNNLRYFKSEFVSRETSLKNKKELTYLATELLCIKEDCYTETKIAIKDAKLFANNMVALLVLFDDHIIPNAIEFIKSYEGPKIKVYVFSIGSDPYTEDFTEVLNKIELCALPDAIYKAYQNVLPKRKKPASIELETENPINENGEQLSIL